MSNTPAAPAPKVNATSLLEEIEDGLGDFAGLVARHSTGEVQTVAITVETVAPALEAVLNSLLAAAHAAASKK